MTSEICSTKKNVSISFSASGWLMGYQMGSAYAFEQYNLTKDAMLAGASGGALVSSSLIFGISMLDSFRNLRKSAVKVHHNNLQFFCGRSLVYANAATLLSDDLFAKKHEELNRRLTVSTTEFPSFKYVGITKFDSIDHFKHCLIASCAIFPIAGLPLKVKDQLLFDGFFSNCMPVYDENTITVSPLYFTKADIRPAKPIPIWKALYPSSLEDMTDLFFQGYEDTLAYLENAHFDRPSEFVRLTRDDLGHTLHHLDEHRTYLGSLFVQYCEKPFSRLVHTVMDPIGQMEVKVSQLMVDILHEMADRAKTMDVAAAADAFVKGGSGLLDRMSTHAKSLAGFAAPAGGNKFLMLMLNKDGPESACVTLLSFIMHAISTLQELAMQGFQYSREITVALTHYLIAAAVQLGLPGSKATKISMHFNGLSAKNDHHSATTGAFTRRQHPYPPSPLVTATLDQE